jgi:hypothetical protein
MKKGEERREKGREQEDVTSIWESDVGQFGMEYDFFITGETRVKENIADGFPARGPLKKDDNIDECKTFFLPDFFPDED